MENQRRSASIQEVSSEVERAASFSPAPEDTSFIGGDDADGHGRSHADPVADDGHPDPAAAASPSADGGWPLAQRPSVATVRSTLHHKEKSKQLLQPVQMHSFEKGGSCLSPSFMAEPAAAEETQKASKLPGWLSDNPVTRTLQNRWVRIVVFAMACFFTTALHYGWQQYAQMLRRDGAYAWRCTEESWDEAGECKAQEDAISALYSIAAGCEYASAALGGIMLDHMGPRKTAFIGEITFMAGTVLLIIASQSAELYIPAMILLGASVNVTAFPSLVTVETFPKWQGLIVALMLASETAATAIPIVLYALMKAGYTFRAIWGGYLAFIWLPITLLYYIALPSNRDFTQMLKLQRARLLETQKKNQTPEDAAGEALEKCESQITSVDEDQLEFIPRGASWGEFLKSACTVDMIVMALYFMTLMMIFAYYPTVVRGAFGDDMSDFVGYILPSQGVTALAVGVICDLWPTPNIMAGLAAFLCFCSVASCFPEQTALQYVSAVVFVIVQPAVFEVKFTFVHELFDPYNFGKLVGLLGVMGGIGTFFNIPIANLPDYTRVFTAYAATAAVLTCMALYLSFRQLRGVTYRTMPDTKVKGKNDGGDDCATVPPTPITVASA